MSSATASAGTWWGDGTTSGTAPVTIVCGGLHYTGTGLSSVLATGGVQNLSGTLSSGQGLRISSTVATAPAGFANNGGVISLEGTADLNVTGTYTQGANGLLAIAVQGTGGGQFGQLFVTGNATLDGVLLMLPTGGYENTANLGDSIPVLDYTGTRTGNFCTVATFPVLSGGKHFSAIPNDPATRVDAVVTASPGASTCPQPPPPPEPVLEPPVNVTPPTITGRMFYKQRADCLPGEWENSPESFSYSWDVATAPNNPVFGGQSFLVPFIFNMWLRDQVVTCTVTATNAAGSATATATARTECRGDEGFPDAQQGRCPHSRRPARAGHDSFPRVAISASTPTDSSFRSSSSAHLATPIEEPPTTSTRTGRLPRAMDSPARHIRSPSGSKVRKSPSGSRSSRPAEPALVGRRRPGVCGSASRCVRRG